MSHNSATRKRERAERKATHERVLRWYADVIAHFEAAPKGKAEQQETGND